MPRFVIEQDGVPFIVKNATTRAQAERVFRNKFLSLDKEGRANVLAERRRALSDMGVDLDQGSPTEGMSALEKFRVGAGRTFDETARGIQQIAGGRLGSGGFTGLSEEQSREIFAQLDDETAGIGAEDIGQFVPELAAFLGGGGALSLAARGALVSGSKATVEGESKARSAAFGGALGAAGGVLARQLTGLVRGGSRGVAKVGELMQRIAGPTVGRTMRNFANVITQAEAMAKPGTKAARMIGEAALGQARTMIQQMNAIGRQSVFRASVNDLFEKSLKEVDGIITMDMSTFVKGLERYSKGQLTKELGGNIGPRLDGMRQTFRELAKLGEMSADDAARVLETVVSDKQAEAIIVQMGKATARNAPQRTKDKLLAALMNIVNNAPATVGGISGATIGRGAAGEFLNR